VKQNEDTLPLHPTLRHFTLVLFSSRMLRICWESNYSFETQKVTSLLLHLLLLTVSY